MFHKLRVLSLGLYVLFSASAAPGQPAAPAAGQPVAAGLRTLSGDDAQRAAELEKAIAAAIEADRWPDAIDADSGAARPASAGSGPEALRDGERPLATRDVSPLGPHGEGGKSCLPIGPRHQRAGGDLLRPGEVLGGPAALREGDFDPPPSLERQ